MSHKEVLARLFPLEMGGRHEDDITVDGAALDRAEALIDALLLEMMPATSTLLLHRWEALYQIVPPAGATIPERQAVAQARYLRKGDIKKPFYVELAATMGYTITIGEYTESMAGWLCAGDELINEPWLDMSAGLGLGGDTLSQEDAVLPWIWEVVVISSPEILPAPALEEILLDLAPPHIQMNFTYL